MRNIVIVDIDGCLNNYPDPFLLWINHHADTNYNSIEEIEKIAPDEYQEYKSDYRKSKFQGQFLIKPGAVKCINKLKDLGYSIVIITARNHYSYDFVSRNTINWLLENNIYFNQIIFERKKLNYIKNIHQYVALVIDDNPDLIDGLHDKYPEIMGVQFCKIDDTSKRPFRVSSWENLLSITDHKMKKFNFFKSGQDKLNINDSVVLIPYSSDKNKIGILNHYRSPVNGFLFEFVAGKINKNENILDSCVRELSEETNILSEKDSFVFLGLIDPYPGVSTERHYVFKIRIEDDIKDFNGYDDSDRIFFSYASFEKVETLINSNFITDSKTISAYSLFKFYLNNKLA